MKALTITDKIHFSNLVITLIIIWIDFLWVSAFHQETPYNFIFTITVISHFLIFIYGGGRSKYIFLCLTSLLLFIGSLFHYFMMGFSFLGSAITGATLELIVPLSVIPNTILAIFTGYYVIKNMQNILKRRTPKPLWSIHGF